MDKSQEQLDFEAHKSSVANEQAAFNKHRQEQMEGTIWDSMARGASFGLNDEVGGALYAGANSLAGLAGYGNDKGFSENYKSERDRINRYADQYAERNPLASMGAEMGGAMTTGGMGAANYLRGKTGAALAGAGGRVGLLEGMVQGLGMSDKNTASEAIRDVSIGGMMGGIGGAAIPAALHGMKNMGRKAYDMLPFDKWGKSSASNFIKKLRDGSGQSDQDMIDYASKLGENSTFAEAFKNGVPAAQGVLSRTPQALSYAQEGVSSRLAGATERVGNVVHSIMGRPLSDIDELKRLDADRFARSNPEYQKFASKVLPYDDKLDDLLQRPSMKAAWKKAQKNARERGEPLPELFDEVDGKLVTTGEYPDFRAWDYMKRALWDVEQKAYKGANKEFGRLAGSTRRALTQRLDELEPDYKNARDLWAEPSRKMDMINEGRTIFDSRTADVVEDLKLMTDGEKADYMTGVWSEIQEKMGKGEEGFVGTYKFLNTGNTKKKLRALFPDGDEGDYKIEALMDQINAEKRLREIHNKVLEGSQTQPRKAAADMLGESAIGLDDIYQSGGAGVLMGGLKQASRMSDNNVNELARHMFAQGGTQNTIDWVNQLAIPYSQRTAIRRGMKDIYEKYSPFVAGGIVPAAGSVLDRYRD